MPKGVYKRTDAIRKKLSEASMGKSKSFEHRNNISKGRKGIKFTEQHCKNISEGHKGQIVSEEQKEKHSQFMKKQYELGLREALNKGIPRTEEIKKKISIGNLGKVRTEEQRINIGNGSRGRKFSKETRKRQSESNIRYRLNHPNKWKDTKPELEVKKILNDSEINYKHQYHLSNRIYDFYLPDYNLLIEVDGVYWHGKGIKDEDLKGFRQKQCRRNDKYKNELAVNKGYNLIRVWEDETKQFEDIVRNIFPILK